MKTTISVAGPDLLINNKKVYSDLASSNESAHGLLFNARFIQGLFDDSADPGRFERFGFGSWDANAQTDRLIEALPSWYAFGLRAFTVGLQGGGPCFTIGNRTINNNPFGSSGTLLDPAYADRLDRLVRAADEIGMICIVSYFYGDQAARIEDGRGIRNAVTTASRFLRDGGYSNVIVEVANEQNIKPFQEHHPIISEPEGMAFLIDLAREESGGMPVGCSGGGGSLYREIAETSDIVLIHGNGQTRQKYYNLIEKAKQYAPGKPVVCNEDSQAIGQLLVADHTHTSWGYYNNLSKQEPPTRWEILPGEDTFFALRMAETVGIPTETPSTEDRYFLHGFEPEMTYANKRWIRTGALYPESIDYVAYERNGKRYWISYDEPFTVHFESNWQQGAIAVEPTGEKWSAQIHLRNGEIIEKTAEA